MEQIKSQLATYIQDPYNSEYAFSLATLYYNNKQYASAFTYFLICAEHSQDIKLVSESLLTCSIICTLQGGRDSKEYDLILHALSVGNEYPEVHFIKSRYHSWRNEWTECYTTCILSLKCVSDFKPSFRNDFIFNYKGKKCITGQYNNASYKRGKEIENKQTIPKIIYHTWETINLSPEYNKEILDTFKINNPDFIVVLIDKNEREKFIYENFGLRYLQYYKALKPGAFKVDFWRYLMIYTYGGFYADIDMICLRSLSTLLIENINFIAPVDLNIALTYHNVFNGFFGSIPKHPILLNAIENLIFNIENEVYGLTELDYTGPGLFGKSINQYLNKNIYNSFINKEGVEKDILLLHFEQDGYIYNHKNEKIILNKNGSKKIKSLYDKECAKIPYYTHDWKNNPIYYTYLRDPKIKILNNYYRKESAKFKLFKHCGISDCIRRGFKWEEHQHAMAEKYIKNDHVVLEAGSHIGTLSVKFSKLAKKVYLFEPIEQTHELLLENLKLNNCKNVKVFKNGLSDEIGETNVKWISVNNPGGTGLCGDVDLIVPKNNVDFDIKVNLITIDSLNLERLDYLKIDVEGYEKKVVDGAKNTIQKYKPIMIIECFSEMNINKGKIATYEEIRQRFSFLFNLGYTCSHVSFEDFIFLPPQNEILTINKIKPNVLVFDNFYKNPDKIREYALWLEYQPPENHGAVGFRCEKGRKIIPGTKEFFESVLNCQIKNGTNLGEWDYSTNGCFQWCNKDVPLVYHADSQEYAGIIYLTPDAPPNCGTSFFRHKKYKSMSGREIFKHNDWFVPNTKDKHLDKEPWEQVDSIGNVYNRLVIFKSSNIHAVTEYFGETIKDSRLFQLFFFNIY